MGPVIAGAGIAARGFTTWLAKKKAREAAARAAVRSTGSASIPNLVTSARPSGLGPFASRLAGGGAAVLGGSEAINAMTQQPNGGDLHPRIESMERLRNPRPHMGMAGLSKGLSRNEGNMANPEMDYPSQDPSYDASRTREGKVQALMEQMDGMNISEEAKQQIKDDVYIEMVKALTGPRGAEARQALEHLQTVQPLIDQSTGKIMDITQTMFSRNAPVTSTMQDALGAR